MERIASLLVFFLLFVCTTGLAQKTKTKTETKQNELSQIRKEIQAIESNLQKMGAKESIAIEGNRENMKKCRRIKEKYGLARTTFYQANVEELYNNKIPAPFRGSFDLIFCLGFLYHLPEPQKAFEWFAKQSRAVFLGTHYVEKDAEDKYRGNFVKGTITHHTDIYNGLWYKEYDPSIRHGGTLDGMSPRSFWLYEIDLLNIAIRSGYNKVHVLGKDLVNGLPYIYILAEV